MGLINAAIGEHEVAVEQFIAAIALDRYLAIAWVYLSTFLLSGPGLCVSVETRWC